MARRSLALLALSMILFPSAAWAHTGLGGALGFANGFIHPLSGLDHVLAMLAVGLLAVRLGGRALWLLPAAFLAFLVLGGVLGMSGVNLPFVEAAIAGSVLVLGCVLFARPSLPVTAAAGLAAIFAVFHGYSHGAEITAGSPALGYAVGFVLATVILHVAGVGLGAALVRSAPHMMRAGGLAMAAVGAGLLAGAF